MTGPFLALRKEWDVPKDLGLGAVLSRPGAIGIFIGFEHATTYPQVLAIDDPETASRIINALTAAAMRAFPVDAGGSR